MRRIFFNKRLLPKQIKHHHFMLGADGSLDYLGQILHNLGYDLTGDERTPADLNQLIPPLTCNVRGKISDTTLTLEICKLDLIDPTRHERILAKLLSKHFDCFWLRSPVGCHTGNVIDFDGKTWMFVPLAA